MKTVIISKNVLSKWAGEELKVYSMLLYMKQTKGVVGKINIRFLIGAFYPICSLQRITEFYNSLKELDKKGIIKFTNYDNKTQEASIELIETDDSMADVIELPIFTYRKDYYILSFKKSIMIKTDMHAKISSLLDKLKKLKNELYSETRGFINESDEEKRQDSLKRLKEIDSKLKSIPGKDDIENLDRKLWISQKELDKLQYLADYTRVDRCYVNSKADLDDGSNISTYAPILAELDLIYAENEIFCKYDEIKEPLYYRPTMVVFPSGLPSVNIVLR